MTCQLGFTIGIVSKNNHANIVHQSDFMSKRVTQSVLAAELSALVHAFGFVSITQKTLFDMFRELFLMAIYANSNCLYDAFTDMYRNFEKHLLTDPTMLHQSCDLRKIV